jgi:hypothetical protein
MKKIFTKEMMTNALVTLGVVMVALAVHEKMVKPRLNAGSNGGSNGGSAPAPAPVVDEEA